MRKTPEMLAAAGQIFNTAKVLRGQHVSMATCGPDGVPNVAPVGSMRVVDENTVHVLQGFLHQSFKNLEWNPKVAFSICVRPKILDFFRTSRGKDEAPMGYQIYGELTQVDDSKDVVEQEYRFIGTRIPFFLRRPVLRFCRKTLKRLLAFRITGVRAIGAAS